MVSGDAKLGRARGPAQGAARGRQAALERMRHMLEAAEAIGHYVERGRAAFDRDPAIRDAIVYQIVVVGEAAKAVVAADERFGLDAGGAVLRQGARVAMGQEGHGTQARNRREWGASAAHERRGQDSSLG